MTGILSAVSCTSVSIKLKLLSIAKSKAEKVFSGALEEYPL